MNIERTDIFEFSLPLVRPLNMSGQELPHRNGLLLRLTSDDGHIGWGETSPLPGFSPESFEEARSALVSLRNWLTGREVLPSLLKLDGSLAVWLGSHRVPGTVRFGVETAVLSLLSDAAGKPPARLMTERYLETVLVNGLVIGGSDVTAAVRQLQREGYRAVKMKVARSEVRTDIERTQDAYHELGDGVPLRLDANRGWEFDQAVAFARGIDDCRIAYIEEPLRDPTRLHEFVETTGLPIALDESMVDMTPEKLAEIPVPTAIVLKPSRLGSLEQTVNLARTAHRRRIQVVFSSCFESSVGIGSLVQLASAFGSLGIPCGLDTNSWFETDLLAEPVRPLNGRVGMGRAWQALKTLRIELLTEVTGV